MPNNKDDEQILVIKSDIILQQSFQYDENPAFIPA